MALSTGKIFLLGAAGASVLLLALSGAFAGSRISELSDNLVVETAGRIHNVALSGITLAVDVAIKNPSRTSLTFRHPFVKLRSNNKDLMTSEIKSTLYTVASYAEKKFTLYFKTSVASLATMMPSLLKEYTTKGILALEVFAKTELTAIGGISTGEPIPYPKTDLIKFGKANA